MALTGAAGEALEAIRNTYRERFHWIPVGGLYDDRRISRSKPLVGVASGVRKFKLITIILPAGAGGRRRFGAFIECSAGIAVVG